MSDTVIGKETVTKTSIEPTRTQDQENEGCYLRKDRSPESPSTTTTDEEGLLERLAEKVQIGVLRFELSTLEQLRYEAFAHKHKSCKGAFAIRFVSNGIGTCVSVQCTGCEESTDITDYGSW